jgi:sarcosine oxidase subunit alpha
MSNQSHRLPDGGFVDRSREVSFTFDGRDLTGHPGDTLASALLAHGVYLTGRSFKYHRPRGIYTAGPEEPNALVTLGRGGRSEPNIPATTVELFDGLEACSQNRWPSLDFDLMAVNSVLKPFFPAGFYYKTFMWPRSFWYRVYEPIIRRAAGLGALVNEPDPDRYEHGHLHADVLVVGAGPAGLVAAREAARNGARVLLVDEQPEPGGHLASEQFEIDGKPGAVWAGEVASELRELDNVQVLIRTSVFGRYDDLTFGALERVTDHLGEVSGLPRQRFWTLHAKQFICTAGAIERPLVFGNNDRPGVMLASAARSYVNRYGVLPGQEALVFTNNDDAYLTARDLAKAGAAVTVVDVRNESSGADILPAGVDVLYGQAIIDTSGRKRVCSARVAPIGGKGGRKRKRCDLICISGGWNPTTHLLSHLGQKPAWNESVSAYTMAEPGEGVFVAGGAAGTFDLARSLSDAAIAGRAAAGACGLRVQGKAIIPALEDVPVYGVTPFWRLPQELSKSSKSFIDLQNDVTISDLELSQREGFGYADQAKRYTTLGMGTDQGKLSNVNALGILADLRGKTLGQTGTTTFRPFYSAVSLGGLAGQNRAGELAPVRHSAMHDWHDAYGAVFTQAGLWMRPFYYPRGGEDFAAAVKREVNSVRSGVGMVDISTLGKIELKGPDAGEFLNRLYTGIFSKMKIGRARYGVMLREDGMVFDDGTISRLGEDHYFITVTTANAAPVMQHMEFCHQVHWPKLDVQFCSVSEAWSAMAIAGPKSRLVLLRAIKVLDLSNDVFPFMAIGEGEIDGAPVRVSRISFSGELAYEVYTPAGYGMRVWQAIMKTGEPFEISAYGTEAMTVMRTEKGHVAGPELDGRTTADDLGLGGMMSDKKDYVGRWMAGRSGLEGEGRLQLVGLKPVLKGETFRTGAHLVNEPEEVKPGISQGHVTTSVFSPSCGCFIGLALLKNGRDRHGEYLHAVSPLHNEAAEVEIVGPVFFDADGERMRD